MNKLSNEYKCRSFTTIVTQFQTRTPLFWGHPVYILDPSKEFLYMLAGALVTVPDKNHT